MTPVFRKLIQFIKHDLEVLVVGREFSDYGSELAIQFFVRFKDLSQSHECSHDGDVHFDGLLAVQHRREHGNALLRKSTRQVPPATASDV